MAAGTAAVPVRELVEHGAVAGDGPFHDGGEVSEAVDEAWMCVMMVCVCVWGGGGVCERGGGKVGAVVGVDFSSSNG